MQRPGSLMYSLLRIGFEPKANKVTTKGSYPYVITEDGALYDIYRDKEVEEEKVD